jgi:small multidrug resistance pump
MLLQRTEQFSRLWPSLGTVGLYAGSFYLLSHAIKSMPLSIAYALWAGIGIILTVASATIFFQQTLDWPAVLGICLIVGGVLIIQLFSGATGH